MDTMSESRENKVSLDETIVSSVPPFQQQGTPLDSSPPAEPFVDGMTLASGINAMTGELLGSPFDPKTVKELQVVSKNSSEWLDRKMVKNSKELKRCVDVSSLNSFTVPLHGLDLGLKSGFDFFDEHTSTQECTLIILTWEKNFKSIRLAEGATLSDEANALLKDAAGDSESFREHYGDYFVYEIACKSRIMALWKCTTSKEEDMMKFRQQMEASLKLPANIVEGSSAFNGCIQSSAKSSSVSIEVEIIRQGDLSEVDCSNPDDIEAMFKSFCTKSKPSFTNVLLRHYHQIIPSIPTTIRMDPELFVQMCDVFSDAKRALLLNSMTSDKQKPERHDSITRVFKTIHASRRRYQSNYHLLRDSIGMLTSKLGDLKCTLMRQELLMELRGLDMNDIRRQILDLEASDDEREAAPAQPRKKPAADDSFVKSTLGRHQYIIGRTQFTATERDELGVKTVDWTTPGFNLEVKARARPCHVHEGCLVFPQNNEDYGNIVGIAIHDLRKDGKNGYWQLPRQNPLGTKSVCIKFKGKKFRDFHWGLSIAYIPTNKFDD